MALRLAELARQGGADLRGDPDHLIEHAASLEVAGPRDITFADQNSSRHVSTALRAGAVILRPQDGQYFNGNVLLTDNPRLCFARIVFILHPPATPPAGRHESAVIDPAAAIAQDVVIGARAVVESGAVIGRGVVIGAGCYIGHDVVIGDESRLFPNVTITDSCQIGKRCIVHSGAVIGSDGFGYAQDESRWVKILQIGRVLIADDVEIGANTTIDRGALGDTVLERGVKLDNLIHIAHNVRVGEDTAIAACVGIAGSTIIGKRCTLAGQVGVVGHIEIADDVHVMGAAVVSHSLREAGTYAGSPIEPYSEWLRNAVRMRQLDEMAVRLKKLEQRITDLSEGGKVE